MAVLTNPVHEHSSVVRSSVVAVLASAVGVFAIAAGITLASGSSFVDAAAVGAFCAAWGGPGFGSMVAGVRWSSRAESQR